MGNPASDYPGGLDSFNIQEAKKDKAASTIVNLLQNGMAAVQSTLGINPQGSLSTLVARLAIMMATNGAIAQGTSFPGSPVKGQMFYRTDENTFYIYDGTSWVSFTSHGIQVFTSSGTFTVPGGITKVYVTQVGGGGGGAGGNSGAGGGNGNVGGATSFDTTLIAAGGAGGIAGDGAGGAGSGGLDGASASHPNNIGGKPTLKSGNGGAGFVGYGGGGGASIAGFGGKGGDLPTGAGYVGGYGGGGGGGTRPHAGGQGGGGGGAGASIVNYPHTVTPAANLTVTIGGGGAGGAGSGGGAGGAGGAGICIVIY